MRVATSTPTTLGSSARVSVIIATFNRQRYIREAIDSMLRQTRPVDEIVVVDDGSTDNTAECIRAYGDRVRYVHKENGGKALALNLGLEHSVGDWLWLFDDDDVAEPEALERFLAAIAGSEGADFAYSGQIVGRDGPDGRIVREHEVAAPRHPPGELFFHALTDYPFRTQGALIHRRCFERVGLFDEKYVRGQDYEFVLRMLRHCRGARVDRPAFVWRVHEGPRGPMSGRHDGKDRKRVWMDFAGLLGHQLRTELRLGEYLLPRVDGPPSSPAAVRSALIHRMSVMASKGLLQEMLEDLREAGRVRVPVDQAPLGRTESLAAWSCATHEYFIIRFLDNPKTFTRHATSLAANSVSRVLIAWLGRGLMYSALRSGTSLKDKSQLVAGGIRLLLAAGTWPRKRTFKGTVCP